MGSAGDTAFWVEIEVILETTTINLTAMDTESGSVRSNGTVLTARNVGDTPDDVSSQAFVSYDISSIPADATITEVVADFSSFDTLGDHFNDLGCLDLFKQTYGTLDAGDYFVGSPSGRLIRWCSTGSLTAPNIDDDMVTALQSRVGTNRFQLRLQFQTDVSVDGEGDMVRFGFPKLTITYTAPP